MQRRRSYLRFGHKINTQLSLSARLVVTELAESLAARKKPAVTLVTSVISARNVSVFSKKRVEGAKWGDLVSSDVGCDRVLVVAVQISCVVLRWRLKFCAKVQLILFSLLPLPQHLLCLFHFVFTWWFFWSPSFTRICTFQCKWMWGNLGSDLQ